MPIDTEVTMEAVGEAKRRFQFNDAVKKQDDTIAKALGKLSCRMWGEEASVATQKRERLVFSPRTYSTEREWEALWYIINRQTRISEPAVRRVTGRTQTISYEAVGVSILSAIDQLPVLAVGNPRHFQVFVDGEELLDWDKFRRVGTSVNRRSLAQLVRVYIAHGPSKVSRMIFLPSDRAE